MDESWDSDNDPVNYSKFGFEAGLSLSVSDNVSIEPSIGFDMKQMKTETEVATDIYDIYGNKCQKHQYPELTGQHGAEKRL